MPNAKMTGTARLHRAVRHYGRGDAGGGHRFDGLHCGRLHQGGCGFVGRERTGKAAVTFIGSDFSAVVFYDFLLGIFC